MQTHKFGFKLFAQRSDGVSPAEFVPVFHAWIRRPPFPEVFIDVADYKHVVGGPGVMLIAQGGHYRMDQRDGRLGVAFKRLRPLPGNTFDAVQHALLSTVRAAQALEREDSLQGRLRFSPQGMECVVYDGRYRLADEVFVAVISRMLQGLLGVVPTALPLSREAHAYPAFRVQWQENECPTLQALEVLTAPRELAPSQAASSPKG